MIAARCYYCFFLCQPESPNTRELAGGGYAHDECYRKYGGLSKGLMQELSLRCPGEGCKRWAPQAGQLCSMCWQKKMRDIPTDEQVAKLHERLDFLKEIANVLTRAVQKEVATWEELHEAVSNVLKCAEQIAVAEKERRERSQR